MYSYVTLYTYNSAAFIYDIYFRQLNYAVAVMLPRIIFVVIILAIVIGYRRREQRV